MATGQRRTAMPACSTGWTTSAPHRSQRQDGSRQPAAGGSEFSSHTAVMESGTTQHRGGTENHIPVVGSSSI